MDSAGLVGKYRGWLRRNIIALNLFETGLSSLTWLLPDRFSESEVSYEALHTAIGLVSTLNESLLSGSHEQEGGSLLLGLSVLQQVQVLVELGALWGERKYGRSRYDALIAYEGLKAALRGYVLAKSKSRMLVQGGVGNLDPGALAAAAAGKPSGGRASEVFDAFVRFRERHCQTADLPRCEDDGTSKKDESMSEDMEDVWAGATGKIGNTPEAPALPTLYWWDREGRDEAETCPANTAALAQSSLVPSEDECRPGREEVSPSKAYTSWWCLTRSKPPRTSFETCDSAREVAHLSQRAQILALRMLCLGETLHILRPLVYVATLRRWGLTSWRPWVISLAVDLASRRLCEIATKRSRTAALRAAASPAVQGTSMAVLYRLQGIRFTEAEHEELARRRAALLYYLLRDPLFRRSTRPALGRVVEALRLAPGLGWAGVKLLEILDGMQQLYTYTSAS